MNMLFFLTGKVCMFFFCDFTTNKRPSHLMTNINGGLIRLEIHPAAILVGESTLIHFLNLRHNCFHFHLEC